MNPAHTIAIATFGRSDFSILRPLARMLEEDERFDVGFWAGGAHYESESGRTVRDVEASGVPIWARIDSGQTDRSAYGTVSQMSAQLAGFGAAADDRSTDITTIAAGTPAPELVVILGDRFEAVAAGLAMVPARIPVAHISGGSITEGAFDDVFRHCLTKIAHLHFCDLPAFATRIHHMGEEPDSIHVTGALGLDALAAADTSDFGGVRAHFEMPGLKPGYILATLHPESTAPELTEPMARSMVAALERTGRQVVYTYPNADPGANLIVQAIEASADGIDRFVVRSFGADWYPAAMAHAGLMVGNSSGGIIEAATFGLPVVDIGHRQRGRDHGPNVLHCERDADSIAAAISRAMQPDVKTAASGGNVYGDGHGAERVVAALGRLDWARLRRPKRFAAVDSDYSPRMADIT